MASRFGLEVSFVNCCDLDKVKSAFRSNTRMVWIETPSNPILKITDIRGVSDLAKAAPSRPFVAVDNTFLSPYFQRPLELGADIVCYSITKYLNGHSDVVMGSVCLNDDSLAERLRFLQNAIGGVPSPFDCYLVNRYIYSYYLLQYLQNVQSLICLPHTGV